MKLQRKTELKNIKVLPNTKDDLDKLKIHPRETYEQLIRRTLLDIPTSKNATQVTKTKKEDTQVKSPVESPQTQEMAQNEQPRE